MAEKTVAAPNTQEVTPSIEETRMRERFITLPLDIYETQESLVVIADVPGVTQEGLDIRVDNNVLTIRGHAKHIVTDEATLREYELANVFRQFELTDREDQDNITADLKLGVLTLTLPKAEAAKPKHISVQSS